MHDDDPESPDEVDAWEIFALAACQPLQGLPHCYVAPRLSAEAVVRALDSYLRPRPDELLLALVERPGPTGPVPGCAITSRRLCWPSDVPARATARPGSSLSFDELRGAVRVTGAPDPALDLGGGREVPLGGFDPPGPVDALAGVLSTIGRARHSGDLAGSATPDALRCSRAEIGHVVRQAQAMHRAGGEVRSFQADVMTATPRVVVTYLIVASCLLVYLAMIASGVSAIDPTVPDLIAWGGNVGVLVALDGQTWRLLSSVFLHGGLIHIGLNMYVLYRAGPLIERLYGNAGFALLYLAAGLGGAMASAWWHPRVVSVGASGAIFGLIGGLGAFLVSHRTAIPAQVLVRMRGGVVAFVLYNTLFGLAIPGIDNAAHLGGLVSGLLAGLLLQRPWPVPRPTAGLPRQLAGGLVIAAALTVAAVVLDRQVLRNAEVRVALARESIRIYNEFAGELDPLRLEFEQTNLRLDALIGRVDRSELALPDARAELSGLISRAEEERDAVARIPAADPDLVEIRDALSSSVDALRRAMVALDRYLAKPEDPSPIEGPSGFNPSRAESEAELARYRALRGAFLDRFRTSEAPPEPGP
ncbi:rhomboid family intramembrane serine protease [Tautonia plasticadhaerens]|uniref:Rhomboid protease GluP n=1 Tax=Tautonia plasticadhaerens TaxID=2527974 RepID=A0A518H188_9BACT|nr:rhomboid family intramembrane serine protease [Tautonia plasticadhaerens]QDV34576.1 Rhomboid protease GluP [Tautonia plasticadhaerens]